MQQYFWPRIVFLSYYNILYWFYANGEKYVKVIDDGICNRKIEFKAKSGLMKRDKNCKEVDKKISRFLKCKEIVALRDFIYKFWFVQFNFWKFVFANN